ncbi:lipoprotein [uncultured Dialister sp.]
MKIIFFTAFLMGCGIKGPLANTRSSAGDSTDRR